MATTLNPYYEGNNIRQMIDEDKFIRCSYDNWYFGEDGTGNLMSQVNLEGLKARLGNVKVDLVGLRFYRNIDKNTDFLFMPV